MLKRDIRKGEKQRAAQRAAHRRFLERSAKWSACPNSGLTAMRDKLVRKNIGAEPLEIVGSDHAPRLVCYHCRSVWHTHAAFTHP